MFSFRKKTREQKLQHRANLVYLQLVDDVDFEPTELETVQILNMVRRKLNERLQAKKSECMEQSVNFQQKAGEIENAIAYLE